MTFYAENISNMVKSHTPSQVEYMYEIPSLANMYTVIYGREPNKVWGKKVLVRKIFAFYGKV